jgi:hypothetical protein
MPVRYILRSVRKTTHALISYRCVVAWNSLPCDFKISQIIQSFRNKFYLERKGFIISYCSNFYIQYTAYWKITYFVFYLYRVSFVFVNNNLLLGSSFAL